MDAEDVVGEKRELDEAAELGQRRVLIGLRGGVLVPEGLAVGGAVRGVGNLGGRAEVELCHTPEYDTG